MKAIRLHEPIGVEGLQYEDAPDPTPALGDVPVKVHACGVTPTELDWPSWNRRGGRTPSAGLTSSMTSSSPDTEAGAVPT
jgi:NADPH:quinone reductase-like Zn-dependent oxidoreductase